MRKTTVDFYTHATYEVDGVVRNAFNRKEILKSESFTENGQVFARLTVLETYETHEQALVRIKQLYKEEERKNAKA